MQSQLKSEQGQSSNGSKKKTSFNGRITDFLRPKESSVPPTFEAKAMASPLQERDRTFENTAEFVPPQSSQRSNTNNGGTAQSSQKSRKSNKRSFAEFNKSAVNNPENEATPIVDTTTLGSKLKTPTKRQSAVTNWKLSDSKPTLS